MKEGTAETSHGLSYASVSLSALLLLNNITHILNVTALTNTSVLGDLQKVNVSSQFLEGNLSRENPDFLPSSYVWDVQMFFTDRLMNH